MPDLTQAARSFRQRGLTTVEYAIAGSMITAAIVLAFIALGGRVADVVNGIARIF